MSCGVNEFSERNMRTENLYGSHHFLCCLHQKLFSQLRTNPPPVVMICWDPRKTLKSFFLLPCQRAGNSHAHPLQWVAAKEWRAVINLGGLPASSTSGSTPTTPALQQPTSAPQQPRGPGNTQECFHAAKCSGDCSDHVSLLMPR